MKHQSAEMSSVKFTLPPEREFGPSLCDCDHDEMWLNMAPARSSLIGPVVGSAFQFVSTIRNVSDGCHCF